MNIMVHWKWLFGCFAVGWEYVAEILIAYQKLPNTCLTRCHQMHNLSRVFTTIQTHRQVVKWTLKFRISIAWRYGVAVFRVNTVNDKANNTDPRVIKLFSCSFELSMKFSLLIDMKMPTIVGIFIFISREIFMLS